MKSHSLRQRIIAAFIGCTVLIALLFGLTSFLFAYHIEDQFFTELLHTEAEHIQQQLSAGQTPAPNIAFIRYYENRQALPIDITNVLQTAPKRTEFAANNGQHFHLLPLQQGYLLADVSDHLIVRNLKPMMLTFLLSLLLVTLLFAALLAYLVSSKILKPLQQLTKLIDQVPVQQLPRGFSNRFAADEIGRFANTLEQALERVHHFIRREQQFTRDVSHELRTPTTISLGALTLLENTTLTAKQTELVTRLSTAQQHITESINTLLELAREQQPTHGKCNLLSAVENSILQQHHKLNDKVISLILSVDADIVVPIAEASLLILLNNLLSNAFSYTASGTIHIYFHENVLSVQDTGEGIDAALQQHIFDDGIKSINSQGMGVGLSLVQRLCEKWQLGCEIQSSKTGTCVRLIF